jgi:virulence factor Mce-like protein
VRRGQASIVANPVLVGAVTVVVTSVAMFMAYNANNGLPFVPTTTIRADFASGANLYKGNEVREGGYRVGVMTSVNPVTLPDGRTVARAQFKLDRKVGDVPADSRIVIRPRSALGLKYLEFVRGTSRRHLREGDTLPLARTTVPVQFDDVFKVFDRPTRNAARQNFQTGGNALAGRGASLNETIGTLPPLFRELVPVAANLADSRTQLGRLFREVGDAVRIVAPVSRVEARLFTDMATTFEAVSRDPGALEETISRSPGAEAEGIRSLRIQRPFLHDFADLGADLHGATQELRGALPVVNPALETGTPVLRRSVDLNRRTGEVLAALRDLVLAPTTNAALTGLTENVAILNPLVRFLGPFQTVCDYWNYEFTYLSSVVEEKDVTGSAQRGNVNDAAHQKNSLRDIGATEPVDGVQSPDQKAQSGEHAPAYLHGQPNWAALNDDGTADCEDGQRGYPMGRVSVLGANTGRDGTPNLIVFDPHSPGSQGTTYAGRDRVPRGETFTREPQNGAQLDPVLTTGAYSGSRK